MAIAQQKTETPLAKMTVRVLDEQGQPISGALVRMGFAEKFARSQQVMIKGLTDLHGEFTSEGHGDVTLSADARKDGYYLSGAGRVLFEKVINGRYQPWNPTNTTILRKVEKPIAMYAKSVWADIPEVGQPCGYDLAVGDWVAPWGKGTASDFIFTLQRAYTNSDNFALAVDIGFVQARDGIQEVTLPKEFAHSYFSWPRLAPDDGYRPAWRSEYSNSPATLRRKNASDNQKFFFRVRTVERNGRIVSALYGKISGGFELVGFANSKTCKVHLGYYLNPTSLDRNMEFDMKNNLFNKLKDDEQPRSP